MEYPWIKLYRKFTDWGWYSCLKTKAVFIHLLITAKTKDLYHLGYAVKRGETVVSIRSLSKILNISVRSVRTALQNLQSTGDILIKTTSRFSIITICNYESYQENKIKEVKKKVEKIVKKNDKNDDKNDGIFKSFLDMFNSIGNRKFKTLDKKTKNNIKERIKEGYSMTDFETAIKNLHQNEYHIEKNYVNATPEFISRIDKLEKYLNITKGNKAVPDIKNNNKFDYIEHLRKLPKNAQEKSIEDRVKNMPEDQKEKTKQHIYKLLNNE